MSQILQNGIYIITTSLGGVLLTYLLFDEKPSPSSMMGALLVPLVVVMVTTWRRDRARKKS